MSGEVRTAIAGDEELPESTLAKIGKATKTLEQLASDMAEARDSDTARYDALKGEQVEQAKVLTALKAKHEADETAAADKAKREEIDALLTWAKSARSPSKARDIGPGPSLAPTMSGYEKGAFLFAVHEASARDYDDQRKGKAMLAELAQTLKRNGDAKALIYEEDGKPTLAEKAWGASTIWSPGYTKATLGATDATGGWIIPNAIVDEFIAPAAVDNIYRRICTVVPGVTAFAVDIPFRSAVRTRASIAAFGATKDNRDLAYNGYTATMYTIAAIYDIGNQFLRQSRGAAENDVMSELAAAFAQGESYYVREGSGSSQPFGYTSALTNGPATFRTTFTPSSTTLAGSMATAIASAAGALSGRGVRPDAAVLSATSYWTMLAQGTDSAGFFFNPSGGPQAINALPGTLVSPWGLPVYPDADADLEGTAAVIDNLVVGAWKKLKIYFGETYRVDSSDQAGTRWDTNLTGFRGEEEMGFDARPAVYAGYFQAITDITP